MDKYACPACNGNFFSQVIATERMYGIGGEFLYLECQNCQSLHLAKIPDNLSDFYPENYYAFRPQKSDGFLFRLIKKLRYNISTYGISIFDNEYLGWLKDLETSPNESIADIGCGNGNLLWQLFYCGFKNLWGFDPYINAELDLENFRIKRTPFLDVEGKFDVLMFHHSFEHFEDPKKAFNKIYKLLNRGGRALIRLPVTDGVVWKKEREYWFQLDAPRHLFIPSVIGMKALGENFGLKLEKVVFDSLPNQFFGTEIYKRGKNFVNFNLNKEFSKSELNTFVREARVFNIKRQGDQAAFFFKKWK